VRMSLTRVIREIGVECQQRESVSGADPIVLIRERRTQEALENMLFFTAPRELLVRVEQLCVRLRAEFNEFDEDLQRGCLRFLTELNLGLGSFLPHWNLQNVERFKDAVLTDGEIEQLVEETRSLAVELGAQAPSAARKLLSTLQAETTARLEVEKAPDPNTEAQEKVGASIGEYLDNTRADVARSNLLRIAKMMSGDGLPTELGNDYATYLQYAMWVGASFVTTNPVLVDIAWRINPARWDKVADDIIEGHPDVDADTMVRLLTTEVVLDNMRRLRPIFLLTRGKTGYVCLQVNPRKHDDESDMISYAVSAYEDLRRKLGGGVPNVVFKLPGTRAGLEACSVLTRRGIGCTITVNFGMFQHVRFAKVIEEGQALVSYLVEMNGRLAYPVRDELLGKLDELADYGIDEVKAREAATWAGVAVLKRLHRLLAARGNDPVRIRPLVASLRIYDGPGYENLPSAFPDITETLGTATISVFPNVRRAFDAVPDIKLCPTRVDEDVPEEMLGILSHSEIFRQAYYVADRDWVPNEDERFRPANELTLEDEASTLAWAPINHTLTQFIDSYDALIKRISERK